MATRVALVLAAACGWNAALAQTDCLTGFNCGRVVYSERAPNGSTNLRLLMQNLDGSRPSLVLENNFGSNSSLQQLVFDAASRRLYFSLSPDAFGGPKIYTVNVDGTGLANLTDNGCFNQSFSISPDGTRIVYRRNCGPTDDDGKIWLMDINGGNQRLLTSDPLVSNDITANNHENPSFSPNGAFVVFTSQASSNGSRQIYRSTLDGNTVVALTNVASDSSYNDDPKYLRGGGIVFRSERENTPDGRYGDLWRMDGDGGGRLRLSNIVGEKNNLFVSPDGRLVLFSNRSDGFTLPRVLYVAKTDGTGVAALWDEPAETGIYEGSAEFSPDGTRIAIQLCIDIGDTCRRSTRVVDHDGGNATTYDDVKFFRAFGRPDTDADGVIDGADSCPAVPNGYRVAMSSTRISNQEIWTTDFNGGAAQRLTTNSAADTGPRFDASGSRIVFNSNRFSGRDEIFSMNANGSSLRQLTNISGNNRAPAFSPDGSKITFISSRAGGQRNVWIMDANGANQIKLTTNLGFSNTAGNPVFNHDGTRIAFDSDRGSIGNANHDIFTISPTGTEELRLTTALLRDTHPSYSPDGSRIVFISFRNGESTNGEIYTMNADGSDQRRVTDSVFRETEPAFTRDGAQIVFQADYDGDGEVYAINRDGTGLRRVTNSAGFNTNPTAAPQPDRDRDGVGDACDNAFDVPTGTGTDVMVNAPDAEVTFSEVGTAGSTAFVPITPTQGEMPAGYTLCETCPAFEITTTASYTPPITVCLAVPASVSAADFLSMRLLHGENGSYVDRTAFRVDEPDPPRLVCGIVQSLSPFALATLSRATSSSLTISPSPSRLGQPTTFTVQVDGIDAAPVGGRIQVVLDTKETCSSNTPVSTAGAVLTFSCQIAFTSYGPRTALAQFIGSTTHADSETDPADHAVMRVADVSVAVISTLGGVNPGEATQYRVELRNLGPDAAPQVALTAGSDPALLGQVWTCMAQNGAVCPAAAGSGAVDSLVDLPAASRLDFVISGNLPQSLPAPVAFFAEALTNDQAPHFVFDADLDNNSGVALPTGFAIFGSGFEAD